MNSDAPEVTSRLGARLGAVAPAAPPVTRLPAWSVAPVPMVTCTCSPPRGAVARVRPMVSAAGSLQARAETSGRRLPSTTEMSAGLSVEHSRGLEKVAVTEDDPAPIWRPVAFGGTVSTVTVRVTGVESAAALSTARMAMVWGPSGRRGTELQLQVARPPTWALRPQPWQETPAPVKGDPSTLASTDVTLPSGSTAEPWTTGWALEVRAPSGIPPVTLALGPTFVAVALTVRGSPMLLPAWSVGPPVNGATVRATWSPPLGGLARVRCTAVAVTPSHETAATPR